MFSRALHLAHTTSVQRRGTLRISDEPQGSCLADTPRLQEELDALQSKIQLSEVQSSGLLRAENQASESKAFGVQALESNHRSHHILLI